MSTENQATVQGHTTEAEWEIHPLSNYLLVEMIPVETMTPGGLHIPDAAIEHRSGVARVIATGPGAKHPKTGERKPVGVQPGDKVRLNIFGHVDVIVNGREYFFCREENVLGIVGE